MRVPAIVHDDVARPSAPTLSRVLETSVYASDLDAARAFYARALGLEVLLTSSRLLALRAGGLSVLLLLQRSVMPSRDDGVQQLSFMIGADCVSAWIDWLQAAGVAIERRSTSPCGSEIIRIRDPDGHVVELVTPGLWSQE